MNKSCIAIGVTLEIRKVIDELHEEMYEKGMRKGVKGGQWERSGVRGWSTGMGEKK